MTKGQILNHDFTKGDLRLYDTNGNETYLENSTGYWYKREYDSNHNEIYYEDSLGSWHKREYDANGNEIYSESSSGYWEKQEYDTNGKVIYYEDSHGYWQKWEYDSNGKLTYFEDSNEEQNLNEAEKPLKCVECSAYEGHSPNCSLIDFKEAKKQLTLYHKLWLEKEMWVRKRSNFWRSDAERWKGKFMELKHENNALRRKVVNNNGS